MRVLHLTPSFPYPADTGGKIGIWNLLRADARSAEIGLLSFIDDAPDDAAAAVVRSVCRQVVTVRRPRTLDGIGGGVRSLLSGVAMNLAKYRWPVYSEALQEMMSAFQPEVVVAHHLHMGGYLPGLAGPVLILREHNIDSDLMERYAATFRNPALALFVRHQARKIRETERAITRRAHCCMMISPPDEARLREIAPQARTAVVPGVIAVAEYQPALPADPGDDLLVVAAGTFTFPPTGEGLVYFLDRVWTRVIASAPRARLRVIGHCPEALKRRLAATAGVEVLGRVEAVDAHLNGAHVFAVPLRAGSGMRMRILEAMAWQVPIVTTTTGCEGIAVENGRHLIVADPPEEMASAILRLARDTALARSLRSEGRRLVEASYSLEAAETLMKQIYRKCSEEIAVGPNRGGWTTSLSPVRHQT
jgi:glycosyltransferase involved in cell wall biosynthesis